MDPDAVGLRMLEDLALPGGDRAAAALIAGALAESGDSPTVLEAALAWLEGRWGSRAAPFRPHEDLGEALEAAAGRQPEPRLAARLYMAAADVFRQVDVFMVYERVALLAVEALLRDPRCEDARAAFHDLTEHHVAVSYDELMATLAEAVQEGRMPARAFEELLELLAEAVASGLFPREEFAEVLEAVAPLGQGFDLDAFLAARSAEG